MPKYPLYKPIGMIKEMVDAGDLGVKTGKGFYNYGEDDSKDFVGNTNRNIIKILRALHDDY